MIKNILITGAEGFVGKNFSVRLKDLISINIFKYDVQDSLSDLEEYIKKADIIFHLAGINRPEKEEDFFSGNTNFTAQLIELIKKNNKKLPIVLSSSIQAELSNPYGISKKNAENLLIDYSKSMRVKIFIYRFPNLFGKWCRPNYNSVVATFCYNISHGLEINISNRNNKLSLVYIDDVINEFLQIININMSQDIDKYYYEIVNVYNITLGDLADKICKFNEIKNSIYIPDFKDTFTKCLYSTFLSYFEKENFFYKIKLNSDERGNLFEVLKSSNIGQIFISTTKPGIERGNHYHNTKIEKFIIIKGMGKIRLRNILNDNFVEYSVSGDSPVSIDIPPGFTHSIINTGDTDLITLFWANEIFDSQKPDTYYEKV